MTTLGNQIKRTKLITVVNDRLREIEEKHPALQFILNVHGLVGTGKTCLVEQLFQHFEQEGYPVLFLNFDTDEQEQHRDYVHTWHEVLDVLRLHPLLGAFLNEDDISKVKAFVSPHDKLLCRIPPQFKQQLDQGKPLLLLIDALDDVPYWKWVQERIIKPLLDQRHTFIVATSQSPLFWNFWELREQSQVEHLEPFSTEETAEYLQLFGKQNLSKPLYDLTVGYPLGLDYLVHAHLPSVETETIPVSDSDIHAYHQEVTERLKQRLPGSEQQDLNLYLKTVMSIGTDFDLSTLREKINEISPTRLPPGRINNAVTSLSSRGFFSYNQSTRRYKLNPLIEKLFQKE